MVSDWLARLFPYLVEQLFQKQLFLGDAAQWDNGYFKILGRLSADIIKSGGYKISALQIETDLLGHPEIADVTVVGIPDITWGQRVMHSTIFNRYFI